MDATALLFAVRRDWLLVIAVFLVTLLGAGLTSLLMDSRYEASTRLFVSIQGGATAAELQQGGSFTQQRMQSYVDIVATNSVLDPVIAQLGLQESASSLGERVTAINPSETVLVEINVSDSSPERAAAIANAVGDSLIQRVGELEQPAGDTAFTTVSVATVQTAEAAARPTTPNAPLNLSLGAVIGLVLGLGLAVVKALSDTTVRDSRYLRERSIPLLASMPFDETAAAAPLVVAQQPDSRRAERFRQLRTNVHYAALANGLRTLVVTSAVGGEGKSTTAINLALAMADSGLRTVIVDADLRDPSVANYLSVSVEKGLSDVLVGGATLDGVLQLWSEHEGLAVVSSGHMTSRPSELLSSRRMEQVLDELESRYDVVVLDSPSLVEVTDAAILAGMAGGAVLVVGSGMLRRPTLDEALASLAAVDAKLLGAVLTMEEPGHVRRTQDRETPPTTALHEGAIDANFGARAPSSEGQRGRRRRSAGTALAQT